MGGTSYCASTRSVRAADLGYYSKSTAEIFTQTKYRQIHESMNPKNIKLREARDSNVHPNTLPVIIGLDVTGSMLRIPHELIKDGLPKMVSKVIQSGVPDVAILFTAFGDAECDTFPLQVGQFESGDEELDTWLTRTYLEGGGGSNAGESYHLVWDFANRCVITDAWEKRQQKGVIITIGDEPVLNSISSTLLTEVYGEGQFAKTNNQQLLEEANKKWNVFHVHVNHSHRTKMPSCWAELLGQNVRVANGAEDVPNVIADIILNASQAAEGVVPVKIDEPAKETLPEIIL